MSEKSIPSVRFDGFTHAWEQRQASRAVPAVRFRADDGSDFPDWEEKKLGNIATIVMGQSPDSKNYSEDPIGKVLVQGNADLKNGKVSPRIWTTESPKSAEPGALLMTVRAPVGALAITDIPVALGRGVCAITGPEILYYQLAQVENNHYWDRVSAGSTFTAIDSNSIRALKLCCPSESEQKKIASLLSSVDETITLCLRKLDLLAQAKKALMQQIFSQQLRFNADDGSAFPEWEHRKLGDLSIYVRTRGKAGNYVGTENLLQNFGGIGKLRVDQQIEGILYLAGDILLSNIRPYLKKTWLADRSGTCSSDVLVFRATKVLPSYLYSVIATDRFIRKVMGSAKGSKMPRGDKQAIMQIPLAVPSLPEQQKIAACLSAADALIDQARAELEQWREVKKSLLQQLFV